MKSGVVKKSIVWGIIFLCIAVSVTSNVGSVITIHELYLNHLSDTTEKLTKVSEVNVPIWSVNDTWIYRIDAITVHYQGMNNSTFSMNLQIEDLKLRVTKDTGPTYQVEIPPTNISAELTMDVNESTGYGPTNISLTLTNCHVKGTIWINKSDLGLNRIQITITGNSTIHIYEFPFNITFPLLGRTIPPVTLPFNKFNISITLDFTPSFIFTKFPLNVSTTWGVPTTNITIQGTISSRLLNIIDCTNKIIRLFHLTQSIARLLHMEPERLQQFSDTLFDILPIINITYVLQSYLNVSNTFRFPAIPAAFYCTTTENMTVPAGKYEAYNISVLYGIGYLYYAPTAGTIIKMQGHFQDIIPFITRLDMELVWTNYE